MNRIPIKAPRWRDRKLLVANWKIGEENEIVIEAKHKDGTLYYPEPIYATGEQLRKYPLINQGFGDLREVSLDDLL